MRDRFLLAAVIGSIGVIGVLASTDASAEPSTKTVRTWKAKCASCHGTDGKADTEQGKKLAIPDFTSAKFQKDVSDADMKKAIHDGFKREGKPEGMDPYGEVLSGEQIDELVAYIRTLK